MAVGFYCLASAVHLVAHETGHFIGGVISKYRLLCLQLGPMLIIKNQNNKIEFKWKPSLSGQCIMIPPDAEALRFKAYNLGGVIANLLMVALSLLFLLCDSFYCSFIMVELLCVGIQKVAVNLIPHTTNSIPNDGYVVKLLNRNAAVQRDYAMYLQLYRKLFFNEPILLNEYQYKRDEPASACELLYYKEIQDILSSPEVLE